jgi:hypothetical protein
MSLILSQRDTWTTRGVRGSGGGPSRTTCAGLRTRGSGSTPSAATSPAAVHTARTSDGARSRFLGANGSMEGGITCNDARSTQPGANMAREKTYACAASTYGRTNAQARSVHSFVPSNPMWHRQTTRAPSSTSGATRPAGCGSWTKTMSPRLTVRRSRSRFCSVTRS